MTEVSLVATRPYQFPPFALSSVFGPDEWDEFLSTLREIERGCGLNSNDRAATLIAVCIESQIDTMANIIGVLEPFGYERGHIAKIVRLWTGNNPDRYWWSVDVTGNYRVIR